MTKTTLMIVFGLGAALLGACASDEPVLESTSQALRTQETEYNYYTNASFTTLVGGKTYLCGSGTSKWGAVTAYYERVINDCPSYQIVEDRCWHWSSGEHVEQIPCPWPSGDPPHGPGDE